MSTTIKQLDFEGQNIYVGIDVHRKQFTISICGEKLFYKTFSQPPKADVLVGYLHRNYQGAKYFAAYEAGFSGFCLQEKLEAPPLAQVFQPGPMRWSDLCLFLPP